MRIISGGQTGIDRMALEVATELNINTGGYAPKGYRTELGLDKSLAAYGLREHPSSNYNHRTEVNVMLSDGTIIFGNQESSGTKKTIEFLDKHHKPYLINPTADEINKFIQNKLVLNVAGNRGSKLTENQLEFYRQTLKEGLI